MVNTDHLLSLLGRQQEVLSRLLNLVREERACLVRNQIERLREVIEQQVVLLGAQRHASVRITCELARLATELHVDGSPTLDAVIARLPAVRAAEFQKRSATLSTLTADVQREGRITWHTAQQAMHYIDVVLTLIGRTRPHAATYAQPATSYAPSSPRLPFDICA